MTTPSCCDLETFWATELANEPSFLTIRRISEITGRNFQWKIYEENRRGRVALVRMCGRVGVLKPDFIPWLARNTDTHGSRASARSRALNHKRAA